MKRAGFLGLAIALSAGLLFGLADTASAAKPKQPKKLTFEQAWKRCTPYAQQLSHDQHNARYARGASCILRFGHRI